MSDDKPPSSQSRTLVQQLSNLFSKRNSKADLREYLQEAKDNNIIDREEAEMMAGVLAVSEQKVRDVMVPRSQMVIVEHDLGFDETVSLVLESGHSRFPVERDEEIIGILLAKDLLSYLQSDKQNFDMTTIMRSVRLIPESKPLDILLKEFRHQRVHMVIVTNEYGDMAGLVTIEDVLEEIVGEIDDEHDKDEADNIKKLDISSYLVLALTEVDEFNAIFETQLDDEKADTIGGHILLHLGYVPVTGEKTHFSGFDIIIKEADDRRIISLVVKVSV